MVKTNIESISKEASILIQLNQIPDSEGVLFLRNYKHYSDMNYWLYLTEYCPSFDLEALRLTYKAMRYVAILYKIKEADMCRRTLPESFIWYLLYAFAKGLYTMEEGPFSDYLNPKKKKRGAFVIHTDMKPENSKLQMVIILLKTC